MNVYEAKQEARQQRLAERAERLHGQARAEFHKADLREEVSGIPLGQPILVGHHSERRHRRTLERADNAMRRGIEAEEQAKELDRRANATSHAISSDDPDAVVKLREKLVKLEATQTTMKAANKLVKKGNVDALADLLNCSREKAATVMEPDFCGRRGFPSYALTNNSANMRRIKERIDSLTAATQRPSSPDIEGDGWTLREDTEENRIMFEFPGKPAVEVRTVLKSHGFKWSPSRMAWVRMLNNAGRYAAGEAAKKLNAA